MYIICEGICATSIPPPLRYSNPCKLLQAGHMCPVDTEQSFDAKCCTDLKISLIELPWVNRLSINIAEMVDTSNRGIYGELS